MYKGDKNMADIEKVKQAFNDFEDDKFTNSSDTLKQEIRKDMNTFLKDKLGLKNDPLEVETEEEE